MKIIKNTAILALISLSAIASAKPASAQIGYDIWTDSNVDTNNCYACFGCLSSCDADDIYDDYLLSDEYLKKHLNTNNNK